MKDYYSDIAKLVKNKYETDNRDYLKLLRSGNTAQLEKLKENEHKRGFDDVTLDYAYSRIHDEIRELGFEMPLGDLNAIRKEAADIANFCHMLIYKCDQMLKTP